LALDPTERPADAREPLQWLDHPAVGIALDQRTEPATEVVREEAAGEQICLGNGYLYDIAWSSDDQYVVAIA